MRVYIRKTHPNLYYCITLFAVMQIAMACNFFFTKPTFNPFDIPKDAIGAIFLTLGVVKLVALNVVRNLKLVRVAMACAISFMFFWSLATTQSYWAHKSSLQLPILYMVLSLLQVPLLVEPAINPVTEKPQ